MKFLLTLVFLFSFNALSKEGLTLVCSSSEGTYYVDLVVECTTCMKSTESPHPYPPMYDKAFIIKNSKDQYVLRSQEFIYEKVHSDHLFADLRNDRLMKCKEGGYTISYEGRVERIGGIGGESTGLGLVISRDGTYRQLLEIKGSNINTSGVLVNAMGQRVVVYGHFIVKRGIERGMYRVFSVDKVKLDP